MEVKNRKIDALLPLIIALVLVAGILIGVKFRNATANAGNNRGLIFFSPPNKINQALELISNSYVDSVSVKTLEEDAIVGMLKNLDPHSQYIPASDFASVNESLEGNFSGIGVQFNMLNDTIVIVNTVSKGPSEKVGIMAGDRIVRVNDSLVAGMKIPSNNIVKMLKGKTGTKVKVSIYRKGNSELLDFTITRGKIPLYSVDVAYMLTSKIGYVKVNKFSKTTLQEFNEAINQLKAQGLQQLILDLRENGGGLIDGAVGMSELFLPTGALIVYTEGNERSRTDYFSSGKTTVYPKIDLVSSGKTATHPHMDLVLLINESSASASEIVAGAIQDNDRGTIIGRRSFGKGLVQEQYSLSDGSAIRITVARYYTPTGRCIQKPYDHHNDDEYYNELNERYLHGEMVQADSIHFDDSSRFVTPGGKVVYGGGGIMPDIFVPIDTTSYSKYYSQVVRKGLMYQFSFDYVDKNRKELTGSQDYKSLEAYLQQKNILRDFIAYAAKQGVTQNNKDLQKSGAAIENVIMAYIARNIFDDKGFYPILNQRDKMVQKGVEVLEQVASDK